MLLTLFIYSVKRSCNACRTALHSCTILSLRSSLVQAESAIKAAPLIILSSLSSRDGLILTSLYVNGSIITFCCNKKEVGIHLTHMLLIINSLYINKFLALENYDDTTSKSKQFFVLVFNRKLCDMLSEY